MAELQSQAALFEVPVPDYPLIKQCRLDTLYIIHHTDFDHDHNAADDAFLFVCCISCEHNVSCPELHRSCRFYIVDANLSNYFGNVVEIILAMWWKLSENFENLLLLEIVRFDEL